MVGTSKLGTTTDYEFLVEPLSKWNVSMLSLTRTLAWFEWFFSPNCWICVSACNSPISPYTQTMTNKINVRVNSPLPTCRTLALLGGCPAPLLTLIGYRDSLLLKMNLRWLWETWLTRPTVSFLGEDVCTVLGSANAGHNPKYPKCVCVWGANTLRLFFGNSF